MFATAAIERRVAVGFLIVLIGVIVIGGITLLSAHQLTTNNALVVHTLDVLNELENLLIIAIDAENGHRGYVITGSQEFLEPYNIAVAGLETQLDRIDAMTSDNPSQQSRAEDLRSLFVQRMDILRQTIELRDEQGADAAIRRVATGEGKALGDQIRTLIADMEAEENALLVQRSADAESSSRFAVVLTLFLVGGLLALLTAVYVVIQRDSRSRRRAEIVLQDARNYAESIVNTVRHPLLVLSEDLRVRTANRAFYDTFQTSAAQTEGRYLYELGGKEWDIGPLRALLTDILPHNTPLEDFEVEADFFQIGRRVMLLDARRLYREGNHTTQLLLAVEDVTDRKQAEAQIRQLNHDLEARAQHLEQANKELEAFSYTVSHDLRAPLRAIDGFSRILIEDFAPSLDASAQRYLGIVQQNALQMGALIDDLLAFSRLNRQSMRKQPVDLAKLAHEVIDALKSEVEGEGADHQVEFVVGDLPVCEADPALLRQVFSNLFSNAVKYSRKRDHAVITVGCVNDTNDVNDANTANGSNGKQPVIYVKDNGVGFDMRYASNLFGVFQRLHRAEDYEGTGVGLATVQRIVQRHGGRIWAEAEPDKGATFYFTLAENGENADHDGNGGTT